MTTKDMDLISEPWEVWPGGVIPAEGNRSEWRLRTPEEGRAWLKGLAAMRKNRRVPDSVSAVDVIRAERNDV